MELLQLAHLAFSIENIIANKNQFATAP